MRRALVIARTVWLETLRRKDLYVLLILLLAFFVSLMTLNVFGMRNLVNYLKETGLLLAWAFAWILTIGISVRQLPQEERSGTIFSLLAKPVSRAELIAGKLLGTWGIAGLATAFFYMVLAGIVIARGGKIGLGLTLEAFVLHLCFIGVLAAMGILFSTRLNGDAAATLSAVLSIASFLVLPQLSTLVEELSGWQQAVFQIFYYALPHLELFDIRARVVHGWDAVGLGTFFTIVLYGILIIAVLVALAWLAYRNKRFNRGVI